MIKAPEEGMSPGKFLLDHVIKPLNISVIKLADALNIPANRLYLIINDKREVTADTALRLGHYFGTGPELWLYVQMKYNLKNAMEKWEKERLFVDTLEMSKEEVLV